MNPAPSLVVKRRPVRGWGTRLLVACGILVAVFLVTVIALRVSGLGRLFSVPTGAMAPAITGGDRVVMEGFSYRARKPRRGDLAVFATDGLVRLPPGQIYIKRIVGEPGERIRISEGKLYVNEKHVVISNGAGPIEYVPLESPAWRAQMTDVTVPTGNYFVVGDNSANSLDSRDWGFLPEGNIKGRIVYRYWPRERIGAVK